MNRKEMVLNKLISILDVMPVVEDEVVGTQFGLVTNYNAHCNYKPFLMELSKEELRLLSDATALIAEVYQMAGDRLIEEVDCE